MAHLSKQVINTRFFKHKKGHIDV